MFGGMAISDESVQILLFVCVPLFGMLILLVIWLVRSRLPSVAVFPAFSLTINSVGWQQIYVVYREGEKLTEFAAHVDRKRHIHAEVPKGLPDEEIRRILPNLIQGFAKLRREYVIYKRREPRAIPSEERGAAIAELQEMGVDVCIDAGERQVQRAVIRSLPPGSGAQRMETISKVQHLMATARGFRETLEVLARSDDERVG